MVQLYSRASGFVFPSTLEACPQTLIEAMSCGVPIAASNAMLMPEICEGAANYFEPMDPYDIAAKIEMLLFDEKLREHFKKTSLKRSKFFDWEKSAS